MNARRAHSGRVRGSWRAAAFAGRVGSSVCQDICNIVQEGIVSENKHIEQQTMRIDTMK